MRWTFETRKIQDLKPHPKNPRRLSKAAASQLETSISTYGQCEPLVINRDNTVIGGHQRLKILKKMGHSSADVYVPDVLLTDEQCDQLNIRLNKNVGEWDYDILANSWDADDLISWGFTAFDLQMEDRDAPHDTKKHKGSVMHIMFSSPEQLQSAENRISTILDEFPGAHYKIKT